MSSSTDQQLVLKNVQLQAELTAAIGCMKEKDERISDLKEAMKETIGNNKDLRAGAQDDRDDKKKARDDASFWMAEYNENKKKLENLMDEKEKQMEVATAIALLLPSEKDYMAKFVVFAADRNVFAEDDPLTNIFKGRKARGWKDLDTSIVKFIIEALASPNERFTLLIYHRYMAKLKTQEEARKAAMKRGLPVSAHSSPDPKKPKADEADGVDFGDSTL
jgi:hypothetical protein